MEKTINVPVPKKGDLSRISNYCPISLTETHRKIFEHCILDYLQSHFGNVISKCQGGFQKSHCCNDLIVRLHDVTRTSLNQSCFLAFLDIKAAYDSVDREILWEKCRKLKMDSEILYTLQLLFNHNHAQVLVDGHKCHGHGLERIASNPYYSQYGNISTN